MIVLFNHGSIRYQIDQYRYISSRISNKSDIIVSKYEHITINDPLRIWLDYLDSRTEWILKCWNDPPWYWSLMLLVSKMRHPVAMNAVISHQWIDWSHEREREREGAREREREQGPRYGTNMQMRWPTLRTSSPMTPSQPPVTLGFSLPYLWSITFLNSSVQTYNTWIQINNELIAESTPAGHHGTEFGKYIERGTECNTIWMSIAYHPASKRIKATNS